MPLRVSAICGLLAPITFIAGWLLGGLVQPDDYSVVDHDISDLGAVTADNPWLYNQLGANLTGLLLLVLALGLWKAVGTSRSARVGVIAFGVFAVGTFLDGLFRLDCRKIDSGCDRFASWHATAHGIETAFTILGVFVAVFALAWAFKKSERWRDLWIATLTSGILPSPRCCSACSAKVWGRGSRRPSCSPGSRSSPTGCCASRRSRQRRCLLRWRISDRRGRCKQAGYEPVTRTHGALIAAGAVRFGQGPSRPLSCAS